VKPTAPIVLAGTTTTVRATGLPPERPTTLERLAPGDASWTPVAETTSTEAGTAQFRVPAPMTADYRAVSGSAASSTGRVIAAVEPAPVPSVVATPSGRGEVTVTWQPTADTGGAPLTRYALRVKGERTLVAPDRTGAVVGGVVAGPGTVKVRAANAVAGSRWTTTRVEVPAYPTISGHHRARKGARVALDLRGLLPHARAAVTIDPVRGRTLTKHPKARADGTATVRFKIRRKVAVVVTTGDVSSRPFRVRPR
jgi:hypothetical protein